MTLFSGYTGPQTPADVNASGVDTRENPYETIKKLRGELERQNERIVELEKALKVHKLAEETRDTIVSRINLVFSRYYMF